MEFLHFGSLYLFFLVIYTAICIVCAQTMSKPQNGRSDTSEREIEEEGSETKKSRLHLVNYKSKLFITFDRECEFTFKQNC